MNTHSRRTLGDRYGVCDKTCLEPAAALQKWLFLFLLSFFHFIFFLSLY